MAKDDVAHEIELQAARFEAILETARDAIISINEQGLITLFNQAAEEIFGFEASEVLGKNVSLLMPEPYRREHDQYLRSYQQTGEARAIGRIRKVEGQRKNGEVFPMELSVSEVNAAGETLYTAVIRDVAERREAELELGRLRHLSMQRQRLADIGALTAKIVHDLANPLAALSMVSQGIVRKIERSPETTIDSIRPQAERLVGTAQRLDSLLGEFKDFARGQRLDLQTVDLGALVGAVERFWTPEASLRGIEIVVVPPPEPIELSADADKLNRVFDNLVKNSVDALDGLGGTVEIRIERVPDGEGGARIRFADSGPGLPRDVDVFALFETTKSTGTGLGLPICRQILAAHGGEILVAEDEPGAVFYIELPSRTPAIT